MGERIVFHPHYTEVFNESFIYFRSIGMTYEQFWYQDPHLVRAYAKAEEMRIKRKNEELYLQGRYVYEAIGAFAEILPAFPKKGAKIHPYLEEPYPLTEAELLAREEQKNKEKMEAIKQRMFAMSMQINARMGEKENGRNTD